MRKFIFIIALLLSIGQAFADVDFTYNNQVISKPVLPKITPIKSTYVEHQIPQYSNNSATYIKQGNYILGLDGTTYIKSGNMTFGTDNSVYLNDGRFIHKLN